MYPIAQDRCQTRCSKSFNLPRVYKCAHLVQSSIQYGLASQCNHYPAHQRWRGLLCELVIDLQLTVCVCVCKHVVCLPRYIPFEGRTGANTVLTSCGASLHRESAAQVLYALQHKMLHVVDCLKISCPVSRITRGIIRSASCHGCFSYLAWWWWCYVFSLLHLWQTRWHRPVADSSKDI